MYVAVAVHIIMCMLSFNKSHDQYSTHVQSCDYYMQAEIIKGGGRGEGGGEEGREGGRREGERVGREGRVRGEGLLHFYYTTPFEGAILQQLCLCVSFVLSSN